MPQCLPFTPARRCKRYNGFLSERVVWDADKRFICWKLFKRDFAPAAPLSKKWKFPPEKRWQGNSALLFTSTRLGSAGRPSPSTTASCDPRNRNPLRMRTYNKHYSWLLANWLAFSPALTIYCYFPFQFVSRPAPLLTCLVSIIELCAQDISHFLTHFRFANGPMPAKPQVMLNGSQPLLFSPLSVASIADIPPTLLKSTQHDAIVFACGCFFRSRLFYDYFLFRSLLVAGESLFVVCYQL